MGMFDDLVPAQQGAGGGLSFDDLIPQQGGPTRITVRPSDAAPQTPGPMQQLTTNFLNQGAAASQGTTADIGSHAPNLLSADTYQNDAGEVLFRHPQTGEIMPTDQNKHVAIRDPADNRVKVYSREGGMLGTDQGRISSIAQMAMTGMGAGAPTLRPGLVAPGTPSISALKGASEALYGSPAIKDFSSGPRPVAQLATDLKTKLTAEGHDSVVAPKVWKTLDSVEKINGPVTGDNLNSLYKVFGNLSGGEEGRAAGIAKKAIGDFMLKLPPGDVLSGDPVAASKAFDQARGNYAAAMRGQSLDKKVYQADIRSSVAHSGDNYAQAVRQRVADILLNPELSRGLNMSERAAMEQVAKGTATQNVIRWVGNKLSGSIGATLGGIAGNAIAPGPVGIAVGATAVPAAGTALRRLSSALTDRQVGKLSELLRSRSPLADQINRPLEEWGKAATAAQTARNARTISAYGIATRNLVNNLKDAGITLTPADLLKSIQGPMGSRADEEQP